MSPALRPERSGVMPGPGSRVAADRRSLPVAASACRYVPALLSAALALLAGCAAPPRVQAPLRRPAEVRARIMRLMPANATDRQGWATDIYAAFAALEIEPTPQNLCATLAVVEQESSFSVDPVVPGLGRIARAEIERRAARHHVPALLVRAALLVESPNGKSYGDRLDAVRTERELSRIYEDFIGSVPLGRRLFADANPVHTGGPMQVGISFAERQVRGHPYPYPVDGSIRHEVFSRRGGTYFGIAHLLGYPASYDRMIYRFADFNAGFYASRNAAFQNAVSLASGIPLALDGDLVGYDGGDKVGTTELAVRALAPRLDLGNAGIRRALEQGESLAFENTALYRRVFALAGQIEGRELPHALVPRIALKSPKISRPLTTEWFASRVDQRYRSCIARASGPHG